MHAHTCTLNQVTVTVGGSKCIIAVKCVSHCTNISINSSWVKSYHDPETILLIHRNGSMSISTAEAGILSSKAVNTSGCSTPSFPITFPFAQISAHLPEKNVGSASV